MLRKLVKGGARVDDRRGDGATPLIVHTEQGNFEVVKLLIEFNANVDLQDQVGVCVSVSPCVCLRVLGEGIRLGVGRESYDSVNFIQHLTCKGESFQSYRRLRLYTYCENDAVIFCLIDITPTGRILSPDESSQIRKS